MATASSDSEDPVYLRRVQYRDDTNLGVRISLHDRFSINQYGWHRWVFDQLSLEHDTRILELGCGAGTLWLKNAARIPAQCRVTLSDFSHGMLESAHASLARSGRQFALAVVDAQSIPFRANSYDVVIANHMLYHVADRPRAFAEVHRVLRTGGRLYAATNGRGHLHQLAQLLRRYAPDAQSGLGTEEARFGLQSGMSQLQHYFSDVRAIRYEDALRVTESEPVLDFLRSTVARSALTDDVAAAMRIHVEDEIAAHGAFLVTKDSGVLCGIKR